VLRCSERKDVLASTSRSCGGVEIDGGVLRRIEMEARKCARDSVPNSTGTVDVHTEVTKELSKTSPEIRPTHCEYIIFI
jgi:hypothetical protein